MSVVERGRTGASGERVGSDSLEAVAFFVLHRACHVCLREWCIMHRIPHASHVRTARQYALPHRSQCTDGEELTHTWFKIIV